MVKILLIEDDSLVSKMYSQIFKLEGFEVLSANNGIDGVHIAKTELPDIILCDIMMPKMNGLEVLDALKSDDPVKNIPIMMLTNLSGRQDSQRAVEKGALAYIVKSEFKPKQIVEMVQKYMLSVNKNV